METDAQLAPKPEKGPEEEPEPEMYSRRCVVS